MIKLFFATVLLTVQAFASVNLKLAKTAGQSNFLAIGNPSAIRIEGQGEAPEGELTATEQGMNWILSGSLKLDLKSYSTGIALRDRHMKEKYLEVEKFQNATLTIEALSVEKAALAKETETSVPFTGTLNFHGISKPVAGNLMIKKVSAKIQVSSKFQIKLSDYDVSIPSFAGIKVADSVEIHTLSEVDKF